MSKYEFNVNLSKKDKDDLKDGNISKDAKKKKKDILKKIKKYKKNKDVI